MRRKTHPLPGRAEVDEALAAAMGAALARNGVMAEQVRFDIRPYGRLTDDRVERIGIGYAMHRDAGARPCFEIVEPASDTDWAATCVRHVDAIAAEVARLERRRDAFDPERTGATPPRWAWDIHPAAASVLSLYGRIPDLDGSHRIDGAHGRIVELQDAEGVRSATIAYGDGVVRLVEAVFPGGSRVATEYGWVTLEIEDDLPETVRMALTGKAAGAIGAQLGRGPLAGRARVTRTRRLGRKTELTLNDALVPWDARRKGGEDWRVRRMRIGKGPGHG